jgi:hypothetical protein
MQRDRLRAVPFLEPGRVRDSLQSPSSPDTRSPCRDARAAVSRLDP